MEEETVPVTSLEGFCGQAGPTKDFKLFRYATPKHMKRDRALIPLACSDLLLSMVQIFHGGGKQEMHTHTAMNGFRPVLRGPQPAEHTETFCWRWAWIGNGSRG